MYLPYLEGSSLSRDNITTFGGLNQNPVIGDGEFSAMENLSADNYPVMTPREKRRICHAITKPHGLFGKDNLMWVDNRAFYYNGAYVCDVEDSDKTFVGMAGYVVIYPDGIIFNTHDKTVKQMNHTFPTLGKTVYTLCDDEGKDYDYIISDTPPDDPQTGDCWMDTSGKAHSLKQYSAYTEQWSNILSTFVKVSAANIGKGFNRYDGVKISGSTLESLNVNEDGSGSVILQQASDDHVVIIGILTGELEQSTPVMIERKAPDMDFVIESNNRLWGCSTQKHEIYASKLGDPFNWFAYEGLATDSFAAAIESNGEFTGIFNYLGTVLFFKENHMHIYTSRTWPPSADSMPLSGVQKGCGKSLALVGQTLFYKSIDGVMAYGGGMPQQAGLIFGQKRYKNAVAGSTGYKYYLSMQEELTGDWNLFVFDLKTNLWHREDNIQVKWFARCLSDLFYIGSDNILYCVTRNEKAMLFEGAVDEQAVNWYGETGDMLLLYPDNKFVSKFQLKMEIDQGSQVEIGVQHDSSGQWKKVYEYTNPSAKKAFTIPIIPMRCDHFKMRIEGKGAVKVFAISKHLEQGSEV